MPLLIIDETDESSSPRADQLDHVGGGSDPGRWIRMADRRCWPAVHPASAAREVLHGSNYQRLAQLESRYHPTNLFRRTRNIVPG
jgi:hypothetical protein